MSTKTRDHPPMANELQSLQNRFDEFLYFLPEALLAFDVAELRVTFMNRLALALFGYSPNHFKQGIQLRQLFAENSLEALKETINSYLANGLRDKVKFAQNGKTEQLQSWMRKKDGTSFPVEILICSAAEAADATIRIVLLIRDLSAPKQAEEALRISEKRYRLIAETATDAIIMIDEASRVSFVNSAAEKIFGYSASEILGNKLTMLMPKRLQKRHRHALQHYLKSGHRRLSWHAIELTGLHKNKTEIPLEISFGEFVKDGKHHFIGIVRDISERVHAKQALQETEERYRALVEVSPAAITVHSEGKIVFANPACTAMFGAKKPDEFLGKPVLDFVHPDYRELAKKRIQMTLQEKKGAPLIEEKFLKLDGTAIDVEVAAMSFTFKNKPAVQVVFRDITERKQTEKRLKESRQQLRDLAAHLQTVREEERSSIARTIHDELGQALTVLKMDLSWLEGKITPEQQSLRKRLTAVYSVIDSTIHTVRRIATELRPHLLDDLGLVAAIEWQAQEFERRTNIKCNSSSKPAEFDLDRDRATTLFRIFQETLTNVARHAQATRIRVRLHKSKTQVTLEVKDNGRGIKKCELKSHKSLGLLGMRERAHLWGGQVKITGKPHAGTTILVAIPLARLEDR